jgi:hypothetical protein
MVGKEDLTSGEPARGDNRGGSKSRKMKKYIIFLSYLLNAYR